MIIHPAPYYWEAQTAPDCVEQTSRILIGELTGAAPDIAHMDAYAQDIGAYNPTVGTTNLNWPQFLRHYGLTSTYQARSITTITSDLAKGDAVAVVVDGPRIWERFGYNLPADTGVADHALVVDSIAGGSVTLTDTGTPTGRVEIVPLGVFKSAWATSGYATVVATHG
jgi:hypothetical protein